MKRLKKYISEMAAVSVSDLDADFLKRAQKVTSFNLSSSDFTSLQFKKEIQHLFRTHFFPKFDLDQTISGQPTVAKLNKLIKQLKGHNISSFKKLHNYNLKGVGPAEATLFFLIDDAHLGGGSSAGVDIVVGNKNYEVKSGNIPQEGGSKHIIGFKLGGTVPLSKIVNSAISIRDSDPKIKAAGKEKTGVNGNQIKMIRANPKLKSKWEREVELPYARAAAKYLGKNPIIFMVNTTPKARFGECAAILKPKLADVSIDVVTQGTIKPRVKIA
tara:strand:- start:1401 stop:2216 length:816 start_codon:yes stop_codon:yes gene_type:complete